MSVELVNLMRIAVAVMGCYIVAVMVTVIIIYCRNLKTSTDKIRRILTGHIVLISFSYAILVISFVCEMMIRYDQPMTWRTPAAAVSMLTGVLGLHLMLWRLGLMRKIHPK